ncbi:maleylpyruvate isomerase N-terminal domain-containing protein [Streptomyces syringium]|uniref:maleylpyruvate isomerase N-terminal domain-containing protein n=1 Tax=Streptomyces syringium TaxID=76729 RepID=UPI003454DF23
MPDLSAVRTAFATESGRVARSVGDAVRLNVPVPGLDWNAGQLTAHLCAVYDIYATALCGELPDGWSDLVGVTDTAGAAQTLREWVTASNAVAVRSTAFASPAQAADALTGAAGRLLDALDGHTDPHESRPTPWYGPEVTRTVGTLAALAVSETLVHGYDLAGAFGGDTRIPERPAAAVAPTVMSQMLPLMLDRERARRISGSIEVRVRGGTPFVLRVAHGTAQSAPADGRTADCVVSLNPCSALLIGFRRQSVGRAVLTGRIIAYGRRPWRGTWLHTLFPSP